MELSLVRVLHIALMTGRQCRHYRLITLLHRLPYILRPLALRMNRLMNRERERMPSQEPEALLPAEHVEGSADGDRHDRELQLVSQLEGSATENAHVTGKGPGSLGKDEEAGAAPQDATSLLVGELNRLRSALVNHNMPGTETGFAHQGDAAQCFLHHPLEVPPQESIDEEYVVGPLMIGHKDIGSTAVETVAPPDTDGQKHDSAHKPAPNHSRIVAPEVSTAQGAAHNRYKRREDSGGQKDGSANENLINSV